MAPCSWDYLEENLWKKSLDGSGICEWIVFVLDMFSLLYVGISSFLEHSWSLLMLHFFPYLGQGDLDWMWLLSLGQGDLGWMWLLRLDGSASSKVTCSTSRVGYQQSQDVVCSFASWFVWLDSPPSTCIDRFMPSRVRLHGSLVPLFQSNRVLYWEQKSCHTSYACQ